MIQQELAMTSADESAMQPYDPSGTMFGTEGLKTIAKEIEDNFQRQGKFHKNVGVS